MGAAGDGGRHLRGRFGVVINVDLVQLSRLYS